MFIPEDLVRTRPAEDTASKTPVLRNDVVTLLENNLATSFSLIDGQTGEILRKPSDVPVADLSARAPICCEVAKRGRAELLDEVSPFLVLALPLPLYDGSVQVAVGTFVDRPTAVDEDFTEAAGMLGMAQAGLPQWAARQQPWHPDALLRMGELVLGQIASLGQIEKLRAEADHLSVQVSNTYEEISLLYRLTGNLRISKSDEDFGRIAVEWLEEVVPAKGLAIQLVPLKGSDKSLYHEARNEPVLLTSGQCPLDCQQVSRLVEHLGPDARIRPIVINRGITGRNDWPFPEVEQLITVALAEGDNLFGWLLAVNHSEGAEFGTVEASLLSSVAAILGIHNGNIELYRQQSELLAGIVRALTSSIDAKDPYTCGHSDRVARVSVRIAQEMKFDKETLKTLYLSGLLHDIGKIGINDNVLRKPGQLTDEEYEHIKLHVTIGHKILRDLAKLDGVLPVVLHHHESWDGGGYPAALGGMDIPLSARIVAVADAYDAMSSDRPYRKGMPDEKIDNIFRSGAGQQWDPDVVDAFFRARDDIRQLVATEHDDIPPELPELHG